MSQFYYEDHPEMNQYNQPKENGGNIFQQTGQTPYGDNSAYQQNQYQQNSYEAPVTNQYGQQMGSPYSAQYAELEMQRRIAAERTMLNGQAMGRGGAMNRLGRLANVGSQDSYGYNDPYGNSGSGMTGTGGMGIAAPFADVLTGSFMYMFIALLVTGIVSVFTVQSGLFTSIMGVPYAFVGLLIAEIVIALIAGHVMRKNNLVLSVVFFGLYAVMNGITLSVIFYVYTAASIAKVFFITAGLFGGMALFGRITKKDLSGLGSICIIGLIGIILGSLVNMFLQSNGFDYIITIVGIVIFLGLTAYDVQKIRKLANSNLGYSVTVLSLWGAMELYLDFINLFLKLLRLMGRRR
ncbi:MAG: Bax inhibitor-1/YccA family protein [Eubacterium sp.]|nr:Bax inhibitor-1/YccA family protein [Eubacterium sp.]